MEDNVEIKLWTEDINGDIFIICPVSPEKNLNYIVEKMCGNFMYKYNLALMKKYDFSSECEQLMFCDNIKDFKFGRLITDNRTYFNIFLSNDIIYSIRIFDLKNNLNSEEVLNELNLMMENISIVDYVNIINKLLELHNYEYEFITVKVFNKFEETYTYTFINGYQKKLTK